MVGILLTGHKGYFRCRDLNTRHGPTIPREITLIKRAEHESLSTLGRLC